MSADAKATEVGGSWSATHDGSCAYDGRHQDDLMWVVLIGVHACMGPIYWHVVKDGLVGYVIPRQCSEIHD